ncbi:MAG: DUF2062 domain-containing protein [Planctomycetaceae bacterium]|nr:DUF2062 domain-containing protein [Planctomycetaceae bacterium]
MLRQILKLSASPRVLLRSVLALDDSPHAIALGTAIGIFVGLTPSVGIQTVLIVALVVLTRRFFYFNGTAAMLSTYISNPLTMVPLYYFWYRLGALFVPANATIEQFRAILDFEGFAGWWHSTCTLAVQVGVPMMIGSLIVAPIGAAIAYPATRCLVSWFRQAPSNNSTPGLPSSSGSRVDGSHAATDDRNSGKGISDSGLKCRSGKHPAMAS